MSHSSVIECCFQAAQVKYFRTGQDARKCSAEMRLEGASPGEAIHQPSIRILPTCPALPIRRKTAYSELQGRG